MICIHLLATLVFISVVSSVHRLTTLTTLTTLVSLISVVCVVSVHSSPVFMCCEHCQAERLSGWERVAIAVPFDLDSTLPPILRPPCDPQLFRVPYEGILKYLCMRVRVKNNKEKTCFFKNLWYTLYVTEERWNMTYFESFAYPVMWIIEIGIILLILFL